MILLPLKRLCELIRRYLAEAPNSLKDHLNAEELGRVLLAAFWAGGGIFGLLQAIAARVGTIFPSPADAGLAAAVLAIILEGCRRLGHGAPPRRDVDARR